MIIPNKHITLANSLLGISSIIIGSIDRPKSINQLWEICLNDKKYLTFDRFILSLDFLFIIGLININSSKIERIDFETLNPIKNRNVLYDFNDILRLQKIGTQNEIYAYMRQLSEVLKNDIA